MKKFKMSAALVALSLLVLSAAPTWALLSTDDSQITGQWNFVTPPKVRTDYLYGTQEFRGVPLVLKHDATAYSATNTTTDAISATIQPWMMTAGKSLRITVSGNITGANAIKTVLLFIDDAAICSLVTASGNAGNWVAKFTLMSTGAAAQLTNGVLMVNGVAPIVVIASDTTVWNTAPRVVKVQIISANGGDAVTATMGIVEILP